MRRLVGILILAFSGPFLAPQDRTVFPAGPIADLVKTLPETTAELQTLTGHEDWVYSVAFSPDGRRIVSASSDNILRLWDVNTGKLVQTIETPAAPSAVAFHPDGKHVVTGNGNTTVVLWRLEPEQ